MTTNTTLALSLLTGAARAQTFHAQANVLPLVQVGIVVFPSPADAERCHASPQDPQVKPQRVCSATAKSRTFIVDGRCART